MRAFRALLDTRPHIWTKVSGAERLSAQGPPYDDFVEAVAPIARFPDRVLWGSDWPHPNMEANIPNDGLLVEVIPRLRADTGAAEEAARRQPRTRVLGKRDELTER